LILKKDQLFFQYINHEEHPDEIQLSWTQHSLFHLIAYADTQV